MYEIWQELGVIQGKNMVNHEIFISTRFGDGKSFTVYSDSDKLKDEMLKYAPEDKALIETFIHAIKIW